MPLNDKYSFRIVFQDAWILERRNQKPLPVERLAAALKEQPDIKIMRSTLTECIGHVPKAVDADTMSKWFRNFVNGLFGESISDDIFEVQIRDALEQVPSTDNGTHQIPEQPGSEYIQKLMTKIHALIGAPEFKALAKECVKIAPLLRANDTLDAFTRRCYLFSVNPGCGMSEYLAYFADLIKTLGLFEFPTPKGVMSVVQRNSLVTETALAPPDTDDNLVDNFRQFLEKNEGKLVCIDISAWMNKAEEPIFRDILHLVELAAGKSIICFRIPFVEHNVLCTLHKQLNDQLYVRDVTIVPFDNAELEAYGRKLLKEKNFAVEDDAWELFRLRLGEEKNDGRFYGFRTVRKTVLEMLYLKQLSDAANGTPDKVIKRTEIAGLYTGDGADDKTAEEMMDEMIGMKDIRERMLSIVHQITTAVQNDSLDTPCIHMRFLGNPGTGKTTVARIIGKLLREKGVLRNGGFVERHSRELCGRYIGETAPKTASICRDAYGSVLFIDEAYSLYRGDGSSRKDYGLEAIDTLIAEMENHRADMVVIMAGYSDDMETLMEANAGLKSRMPFEIRFPNYTREQLAQIFMLMANKAFICSEAFEAAVYDYFNKLDQTVLDAKDFSNARFVRNLYERTWGKAVLRCQLNGIPCTELKVEDLALALSDQEFQHIISHRTAKPIGFTG